MSLDEVISDDVVFDVIASVLQLFEFLDWFLTSLAFTSALSVALLLAGAFGIVRSRLAYARTVADSVKAGAE